MKHCSYCGAEYSDDLTECPIDHEPMVEQSVVPKPQSADQQQEKYDIRFLPSTETDKDYVTILTPKSRLEADIILGRLQAYGFRVRFYDSVIGGWIGQNTALYPSAC